MSFLDKVSSETQEENDFELIFGMPKVGKTTFACAREGVILMDIENGSRHIKNVNRLPIPQSFDEVMAQITELLEKPHDFKTFVLDSLDHCEALVNKAACEENNWTVISDGAFGKGGDAARHKWQQLIQLLKKLRTRMHILLIAHSQLRTINDPMKQQAFDKHDLKLQEKTAALFKESVDAILFCQSEVLLKENKAGKAKLLNQDEEPQRWLLTQGRSGHEGGNRYGIPYRIELDYPKYKEAREAASDKKPIDMKAMIIDDLKDLKDQDLKKKILAALEQAKDDSAKLQKIWNKLQTILAAAA